MWLQRESQRAWAGLWAQLSALCLSVSMGVMPACAPHRGLGEGPGAGRCSAVLHTVTVRKWSTDLELELGVIVVVITFIFCFFFFQSKLKPG